MIRSQPDLPLILPCLTVAARQDVIRLYKPKHQTGFERRKPWLILIERPLGFCPVF
jgi:hypothetical protein